MDGPDKASASRQPHRRMGLPLVLCVGALGVPSPSVMAQGSIVYWGNVQPSLEPPPGTYIAVSIGEAHCLALRPDGTMVGWGSNIFGESAPQPGTFVSIAAGQLHSVALRSDGVAVSWGWNDAGQGTTPAGTFVKVAAGYGTSAGIRTDGTLHVWGLFGPPAVGYEVPTGTFTDIAVGVGFLVAIRTDGTLVSWGQWTQVPSGTFTQVHAGGGHAQALSTSGSIALFGKSAWLFEPVPTGQFVALGRSWAGYPSAVRADRSIVCWGPNTVAHNVPPGRYLSVSMASEYGMAIPVCYSNCDCSTGAPFNTANDFMCFLNRFASGDSYANCDGSTGSPALTANDFQCFLNKYAAGCS